MDIESVRNTKSNKIKWKLENHILLKEVAIIINKIIFGPLAKIAK